MPPPLTERLAEAMCGCDSICFDDTWPNNEFLFCLCSVIPKANSVFTFELGGFEFTIHGSHFCFRSSERSARRFKPKATTDL